MSAHEALAAQEGPSINLGESYPVEEWHQLHKTAIPRNQQKHLRKAVQDLASTEIFYETQSLDGWPEKP